MVVEFAIVATRCKTVGWGRECRLLPTVSARVRWARQVSNSTWSISVGESGAWRRSCWWLDFLITVDNYERKRKMLLCGVCLSGINYHHGHRACKESESCIPYKRREKLLFGDLWDHSMHDEAHTALQQLRSKAFDTTFEQRWRCSHTPWPPPPPVLAPLKRTLIMTWNCTSPLKNLSTTGGMLSTTDAQQAVVQVTWSEGRDFSGGGGGGGRRGGGGGGRQWRGLALWVGLEVRC